MRFILFIAMFITFFIKLNTKRLQMESEDFKFKFDKDDPIFRTKGNSISRGSWNFMAALFFSDGSINTFCQAIAIRKDWLVTTAHCVPEKRVFVRGKFGKSFTNEEGQIIYPKYVIQHPDYVMEELSGYFNDITLIKLDNDVNLEEGSLAQIASAPLRLDAECKTVGWGVDKSTKDFTLLEIEQPVITLRDCKKILGHSSVKISNICSKIYEDDPYCMGDTGAPLFCNGKLYGIISWGLDCMEKDYPIIWTNLVYFKYWIDQTIQKFDAGDYETEVVVNLKGKDYEHFGNIKRKEIKNMNKEDEELLSIYEERIKEPPLRRKSYKHFHKTEDFDDTFADEYYDDKFRKRRKEDGTEKKYKFKTSFVNRKHGHNHEQDHEHEQNHEHEQDHEHEHEHEHIDKKINDKENYHELYPEKDKHGDILDKEFKKAVLHLVRNSGDSTVDEIKTHLDKVQQLESRLSNIENKTKNFDIHKKISETELHHLLNIHKMPLIKYNNYDFLLSRVDANIAEDYDDDEIDYPNKFPKEDSRFKFYSNIVPRVKKGQKRKFNRKGKMKLRPSEDRLYEDSDKISDIVFPKKRRKMRQKGRRNQRRKNDYYEMRDVNVPRQKSVEDENENDNEDPVRERNFNKPDFNLNRHLGSQAGDNDDSFGYITTERDFNGFYNIFPITKSDDTYNLESLLRTNMPVQIYDNSSAMVNLILKQRMDSGETQMEFSRGNKNKTNSKHSGDEKENDSSSKNVLNILLIVVYLFFNKYF